MKKNFLMAMLAMGLVLAMAFTGCDEVLNEPKKGTETEVTGYGITSLDQSAVTCTVIFDPQGGDMGNVPKGPEGQVKIFVPVGETATKPSPDPTKAGYTFGGWYTDTTFKSLYDFNATVKVGFTVYAKWMQNLCKLKYSLNGAPGTPPDTPGYITYGQTITEPAAPKWTGHTFVGWFRTADGTGTAWNFKTDTVTEDFTLYAKWALGVDAISFAAALVNMADNKAKDSMSYTLPSGDENYPGSYTLNSDDCPAKVTIDGDGDGDGNGRVVTGNGTLDGIVVGAGITLTLKNITFNKLKFTVDGTLVLGEGATLRGNSGSGVTVRPGGTLQMEEDSLVAANGFSGVLLWAAGASESPPMFTMNGGTISGNYCSMGGGVRMEAQGSKFTMNGGLISGNSAGDYGGGVIQWGAGTEFTMSGGEISGNSTAAGGGVALNGDNSKFTMSGGVISGNITTLSSSISIEPCGGGVIAIGANSVFTMTAGEISGNEADRGGGVALIAGKFYMSGGVITKNWAEWSGGGVHVWLDTTFNMTGGEITGNTSSRGSGGLHLDGTLTGNPRIGNPVTSGSGPGWIYGNTLTDTNW